MHILTSFYNLCICPIRNRQVVFTQNGPFVWYSQRPRVSEVSGKKDCWDTESRLKCRPRWEVQPRTAEVRAGTLPTAYAPAQTTAPVTIVFLLTSSSLGAKTSLLFYLTIWCINARYDNEKDQKLLFPLQNGRNVVRSGNIFLGSSFSHPLLTVYTYLH